MGKFKVGDRVRVKVGHYEGHPGGSPYNLPRADGVVESWTSDSSIVVRYGDRLSPPVNGIVAFELVNEGPVRTVTRKEIVPGEFGNVVVHPCSVKGRAAVSLHVTPWQHGFTSAELTAAIATLTTIRDALDEVA